MISRADFIFTVGYDGTNALVDSHAKRRYGQLDTRALAEAGFLRAAFCSALYSKNREEQDEILAWFKEHTDIGANSFELLKQYFGVSEIPADTIKVVKI